MWKRYTSLWSSRVLVISLVVTDYKCFGLIFIWIGFVRRCIRSESLQIIIGDRAVETGEGQFIENDGLRIWLEKMDCLLEITSTLIRTSVLDTSYIRNEKIIFYWKFSGMYRRELFDTAGLCRAATLQNSYSWWSELFRTNHFSATFWQGFSWDNFNFPHIMSYGQQHFRQSSLRCLYISTGEIC